MPDLFAAEQPTAEQIGIWAAVLLLMVPGLAAYANAPLGFALGLSAGLGWAIGTLILKRRQVLVPATVLTGWQLLITAVPTTAAAVARRPVLTRPSAAAPGVVLASHGEAF